MSSPATTRISDADIADRFRRLAAQWKEQSLVLSNTAQMAMLKPYQQIIGLGMPAVPLILQELQREADHWFWALEAITGENPVPNAVAGDVKQSARAWIEWGIKNGLLECSSHCSLL